MNKFLIVFVAALAISTAAEEKVEAEEKQHTKRGVLGLGYGYQSGAYLDHSDLSLGSHLDLSPAPALVKSYAPSAISYAAAPAPILSKSILSYASAPLLTKSYVAPAPLIAKSYVAPALSYSAAPSYGYAAAPSYSYAAPAPLLTKSVVAPSYSYAAAPSYSYAASAPLLTKSVVAPSYSYAAAPSYSYAAAPSYSYAAPAPILSKSYLSASALSLHDEPLWAKSIAAPALAYSAHSTPIIAKSYGAPLSLGSKLW